MIGGHDRTAFFGHWVVCPSCERPFAWKEARVSAKRDKQSESRPTHSDEEQRRRKMKALRDMIYSLAAITTFGGSVGFAQNPAEQQALVITADNLMAGNAQHRELADNGGDANTLLKGDVVQYRLVFTNVTDAPVRNVEFNDPLPGGLRYVAETATADRGDVVIEYSIDGGQSFSARPMVQETVAGEQVQRPAPPDRYTHIRWRIDGWVQPGAQVTAAFQAQLPEQTPSQKSGD